MIFLIMAIPSCVVPSTQANNALRFSSVKERHPSGNNAHNVNFCRSRVHWSLTKLTQTTTSSNIHSATPKILRLTDHCPSPKKNPRWQMKKTQSVWRNMLSQMDQAPQNISCIWWRDPQIISQALALATEWLTGQMPQMRGVIAGISVKYRLAKFSNPRNSLTWNCASRLASLLNIIVILWPSMRVTGPIKIVLGVNFYPYLSSFLAQIRDTSV